MIAFICLLVVSIGTDTTATYAKSKPVTKDFLLNKNKIYTYERVDGIVSIEYMETDKEGYRFWGYVDVPQYYIGLGKEERQNKKGYYFYSSATPNGRPDAVTNKPVKGKKYTNKYGSSYVVTSTNATVKTKYKTFKNCMVIKYGNYYEYYAPHYGLVKSTTKAKKGFTTDWELISVKNKKK
ncbi:hypothetical protein ACFVP8_20330 [Viridibacillus arvi]|uniref:hypothetical protein n=1 Tax=Viridibacillus arvi TaxID=263475 RepID=UPI0036CC8AC3